jgi:hypothetical protein
MWIVEIYNLSICFIANGTWAEFRNGLDITV